MEEFIIPDEGVIVKTRQGRVILDLVLQDETSLLRMIDINGKPKIGLGYSEDGPMIFLGDQNTSVFLQSRNDVSEINITNSGKNIALAVAEGASEIRFQNENGEMTNKIFINEFGGQVGLSDNDGNLLFTAGATEEGGLLHILNNNGNTTISLATRKDTGQILLLDENGKVQAYLDCSCGNGVIVLLDKEGNDVWSSFTE